MCTPRASQVNQLKKRLRSAPAPPLASTALRNQAAGSRGKGDARKRGGGVVTAEAFGAHATGALDGRTGTLLRALRVQAAGGGGASDDESHSEAHDMADSDEEVL